LKPRLLIIFLLIVLLPLALITFLGLRLTRYEQQDVNRRLTLLLTDQLHTISTRVAELMEQRRLQILKILSSTRPDPDALRTLTYENPYLSQVFLLRRDGSILYPNPRGDITKDEFAFLQRAQEILSYDNLIGQSSIDKRASAVTRTPPPASDKNGSRQAEISQVPQQTDSSWYVWFWGQGLQTILWQRLPNGDMIGAELDRARLLADIIGVLPEEGASTDFGLQGRIILCDAADKSIYQWGRYEPPKNAAALAQIPLGSPLSSWRLKYYLAPDYARSFQGKAAYLALAISITAATLALILLAVYFYRENTRQIQLAGKRVTFVNQVSHELKTPLTNIRMYAELLQDTPPEDLSKTRKYLSIIVDESHRLTRLIANILSFSKSQRDKLKLRFTPVIVDDVIQSVLDNFKASFEKRDIAAEFDAAAPDPVLADPDAIAQILGNLLSNVEKYAASGRYVKVTSRHTDATTRITVADKGPGIPSNMSDKIFQPFQRISNKLTDGVSGTGIGLTISRQIARLHGGDTILQKTETGAAFEVTLKTAAALTGETP
jgi:signal transduction histidine kinase